MRVGMELKHGSGRWMGPGITIRSHSGVRGGQQVAVRKQVVLFSLNLRVQCNRMGTTELGQSFELVRGKNSHKVENRAGINSACEVRVNGVVGWEIRGLKKDVVTSTRVR